MDCKTADKIKKQKAKLVKGSIAHIRMWKKLQVHIDSCSVCSINIETSQIERSLEGISE